MIRRFFNRIGQTIAQWIQERSLSRSWQQWTAPLRSGLKSKELAVLEACLIGLVSGIAAVLLKQGVGVLGTWRVQVSLEGSWFLLPLMGAVGGFLAGWLTQNLAPETSGSGIPQVKAALAHWPIALNLRVALVKMTSTLLVMGSGMALGRQGPTVQIGSALAGQLSHWVPTSPDYRRQMLAAGAAAGLAAGFNAPLAGVLFVIEELLQDLSSLTLGTAIVASFTGAVVSRQLGGQGLLFMSSLKASSANLTLAELPFLLLIGLLAGILGGFFCRGILASRSLYQRFIPLGLPWRVALAGLISGLAITFLPATFRDNAGVQEYLLSSDVVWYMVLLAFVSKFCLTLIATGSGASGGLFAPSLILGSSLGYLVPILTQAIYALPDFPTDWIIPITSPSTYALTGMGALFSAVAKTPMTAIVIVFEMSSDFNLVLPLMVTSIIAYGVGNSIFRGSLYDRLMDIQGFRVNASRKTLATWETLTAAQVMQSQVETLHPGLTLAEAYQVFLRSSHRGFPVVQEGELVGILAQSDLSHYSHFEDGRRSVQSIMTRFPITVQPRDTLNHVLHLLNHHQIGRLPVTEGRKLVGIITLADIIRAEAQHLEERDNTLINPSTSPSYVVYQTHAPETGRGRLLVPLANPKTAPTLLQLAASLARDRDYELECLQVISIPKNKSPHTATVDTRHSRKLLEKAVQLGEDWGVPVHTQIRVTHEVAPAILEAIRDRRIDLMLMGWKGSTDSLTGLLSGDSIDTLIRQAPCTVVLVKLADRLQQSETLYPSLLARLHFNRWLVSVGTGPNTQEALKLLPALTAISSTPEIKLCQVSAPDAPLPSPRILQRMAQRLRNQVTCPVEIVRLIHPSVAEAILDLAQGISGQETGLETIQERTAPNGEGINEEGINEEGINKEGINKEGIHEVTNQIKDTVEETEQNTPISDEWLEQKLEQKHDRCDVIVMGASRDHLLQQMMQGTLGSTLPEEIARRSPCTVLLIRTL